MRIFLPLLILLSPAAPVFAADGVLEINQICAVETGCFPGDAAGFPVTISESNTSYRLTGSLEVTDENTQGINFASGVRNVSIDLGGFTILGPNTCVLPCSATGTGTGIGASPGFGSNSGITVRNGTIRGMGGEGVGLGNDSAVIDVNAIENGAAGIRVSINSLVSGCTARFNGGTGIIVGVPNGAGSSQVIASRSVQNDGDGISAGRGSVVSDNVVTSNDQRGINARDGVTVLGNAVASNGSRSSDHGIECDSGCLVRDNTTRGNAGFGIHLGPESAYGANVISNNGAGTVSGGSNILLNRCDGAAAPACP